MILTLKTKARVLVGSPNVLGVRLSAESKYVNVEDNMRHVVNVDYTIHKMLDFEGMPCNKTKGYRLYECAHKHLDDQSKKNFGCVSPFGISKNDICVNDSKAIEAYQLYSKYKKTGIEMANYTCLEPCSFLSIKIYKVVMILSLIFGKSIQAF